MSTLQGLGVSDGIAIGKAVCINTRIVDVYQIPLPSSEIEPEIGRFRAAVDRSRQEIQRMQEKVSRELGEDLAGIFDAQVLFLSDSSFLDRVIRRIREENVNAEWALQETASEIHTRFDEIDTEHLRERSEDLRDVCRYVMRSLRGMQLHQISEIGDNVVIVADDLTPSDAVRLGREKVAGFAVEHGGRTSHTTIIAHSLNIPAVIGLRGLNALLADQGEVELVVDGGEGVVIVHPDTATLIEYRRRLEERERHERELLETSALHAVTRDGVEVRVMANIDLPEEVDDVRRFGATGVGLYRSEFLYIEKSPALPTEEEHLEIYRRLVEAAAPNPAIIRTYDLGGRKIAREVIGTHEANPVLGLRGIRLTLARPDIFKTQIRALLRATAYGNLWIMLPMVSIVEEVRQFRSFAEEVMGELEREGVPFKRDFKLGIMVEVPSAAIISDILAREVDFFSIGTNDLIQYSLAVDRNNEHVANLYRPLHPAMLRMLRLIIHNAAAAGIEVGLCGEVAGESRLTPILLGCGLRSLSLRPRQVPAVKSRVREISVSGLDKIVETCSNLATAEEIDTYLRAKLGESVAAVDEALEES